MTSLPMDPATSLRPPDWHSGLQDTATCARFDPSVPHPARVYAYWLGGKDHHRADREAAEEVMRRRPQVVAGARANRAFLVRVVRYLAGQCGIRQFLDIGTGLPAPDNTHEIAQAIAPDCRVVYADDDPLVLAYARALLTSGPRGSCDYVDTDLRDTSAVLAGASQTWTSASPPPCSGSRFCISSLTATTLPGSLPPWPASSRPAAIWPFPT